MRGLGPFLRDAWRLARPYYSSEEKWAAWGLLLAGCALVDQKTFAPAPEAKADSTVAQPPAGRHLRPRDHEVERARVTGRTTLLVRGRVGGERDAVLDGDAHTLLTFAERSCR